MMGVIVSLVFLILPWFPQYFLCVKWNTFFTRISLPLYHSFIQEWLVPAFFENFLLPPFCSLTKNPKILFPPPVKEKNTMKQIAHETTKVNIPNLLRDWKTRTGFIRYKQLTQDLTLQHNRIVNQRIARFKNEKLLPKKTADGLKVSNPKTPKFYISPKIHKPNNPGRPVINSIECHTSEISRFVDHHLQPLVKQIPSYINDTNHFINKVKKLFCSS